MYNLNDTNLIVRQIDNISIGNDLDNQTLQYLINKYFYVTGYTYNDNQNLIKINYDIYNDSYVSLLSDSNLTVNIKKLMVFYILASMTGIIDIYMLINNQFLDTNVFVFNVRRRPEILYSKQYGDSRYNDYLLYIDINQGHHIDYQTYDEINVKSSQLIGLREKHTKISGQYSTNTQLSQTRMALIENDTLTESDYNLIKEVYNIDSNNYYESKKFIYKLIFDNNQKWILQLKNVYLMFGLRNQINDFVNIVNGIFNPNVLKIKTCSAVMDDSNIVSVGKECAGHGKYAEDFQFGTTSGGYNCSGQAGPYREITDYYSYFLNIYNQEIKDYVLDNFFSNSEYMNNSDFNTKSDNCLNTIKECYNFYSQQIEYYDLKSQFVDSNIGDINNAYYVDVFGYDSTNMKPIVLYISNKVQLDANHYIFYYKLWSGGIIPINNDYLQKPYDKTVSESSDLIASLVINMYEPPNKMDVLQTYMDVMGISCDKPLHINPVNDNIPQLINNKHVDNDVDDIDTYLVQKHEMYQYAIKADTLIPQQAMADLFNTTPSTCTDFTNLLNNYFVYDTTDINLNVEYNTIFLRYHKYMEPKYFYFITKNHLYDQSYSNLITIKNTYDEIKNLQFLDYLIDTTTYSDLTIARVGDMTNDLSSVEVIDGLIIDDIISKIPSAQIVNMDCTDECNFGQYTLKVNDILSNFFNERIIEFDKTAQDENDLYLIYYKYSDIIKKSPNNFIVANKVIGTDQLLQYGFKSSHTDIAFNNLFLSSILSFDGVYIIYDVFNSKISTLKFNNVNLEFIPNTTKPLKFNVDIMYQRKMQKFNRSDYNLVLNILNEYNYFQQINNIRFAFKPYDVVNNTIFYPFCNDYVLIKG